MGKVIIQNYTCKNPITMIGFEAGICWGADTGDEKKKYPCLNKSSNGLHPQPILRNK